MFIRPATLRDLKSFNPTREDIREAYAAGVSPQQALSRLKPEDCVVLEAYNRLFALGGNVGDQVWFLTDHNVKYLGRGDRVRFRKCILEYRNEMLKQYPTLWNFVWMGNTSHIRFLKSIGAVFHNEFTGDNNQFQLFTIGG